MNEKHGLIFVKHIGDNINNEHIYHLLFASDYTETWVDGWEEPPACNIPNLTPEDGQFEYIKELSTEIKLDLAQQNCCFSYQDAKDGIIAVAFENMDEYEEYPEPYRIVLRYGMDIQEVDEILQGRGLSTKYI